MGLKLWKVLRNYLAVHELLWIVLVSLSMFVVIFWFLYSAMIPPLDVKHRLDYWSMHCGLISNKLRVEISDLQSVKQKLLYELAIIESKRSAHLELYKELEKLVDELKKEKGMLEADLSSLTISYRRLKDELLYSSKELSDTKTKTLKHSNLQTRFLKPQSSQMEEFDSSYERSDCLVSSVFSFYLAENTASSHSSVIKTLEKSRYRVMDPKKSCLIILPIEKPQLPAYDIVSDETLRVVYILNSSDGYQQNGSKISFTNPKASVVAANLQSFRPKLDIIVPLLTVERNTSAFSDFKSLGLFTPLRRAQLISFETCVSGDSSAVMKAINSLLFIKNSIRYKINVRFGLARWRDGYDLASTVESRLRVLSESTFVLVAGSTPSLQIRLVEALSQSAIPIIIATQDKLLPFNEFIDWRAAALFLPLSSVTDILTIANSLSHNDLMALKKQGRDLYIQYFVNSKAVTETVLEVWRYRFQSPGFSAPAFRTTHRVSISPESLNTNADFLLNHKDSPLAVSNFSHLIYSYRNWNTFPGPFWTYSSNPNKAVLPSEAKFSGSEKGFRPINFGKGGDGKYFKLALGGDVEVESFTILILSYKREQLLMQMIKDFDKLSYLHSVIVVWNSPGNVSHNLVWPQISAPIHIVKGPKNSLNNRFLPYEEIKTEAVLSLDDDVFLSHEEILLTFRVWRENRDRIVGLPGRLHSWDAENKSWVYNNYLSCELSLVLTGAAFVHKYYFYLYTHSMPSVIRDRVDEYMNCEDIAINFLVAHVTRKPPIKATSKRTFYCAQCGDDSLWIDGDHYKERSDCINFFSVVYGYNPLMSTQFRADSILYRSVFADPELATCFDKV